MFEYESAGFDEGLICVSVPLGIFRRVKRFCQLFVFVLLVS
jgi:hypothetical protein